MALLEPLSPDEPNVDWDDLDCRFDSPNFRKRIASGVAALFRIAGTDAALMLSVGITKDSGIKALWIEGVEGSVGLRPHANLRLMQGILGQCEAMARYFGCREVRIEANSRQGWKLRLLPKFGFELTRVPGANVMRKVI